jgi:hypothetical protein
MKQPIKSAYPRWIIYLGFKPVNAAHPSPRYRNGFLFSFYMALAAAGIVSMHLSDLKMLWRGELPNGLGFRGFFGGMIAASALLLASLSIFLGLTYELLFGRKPRRH